MSEYSYVQKGALKLKGVSDSGIKKKKKKSKDMQRVMEQVMSVSTGSDNSQDGETTKKSAVTSEEPAFDSRTPTEIAFDKAKEDRRMAEMLKKPMKTHKERIMDFNEHLDNLSEHYDIPKVSWTK